MFEIISLDYLS